MNYNDASNPAVGAKGNPWNASCFALPLRVKPDYLYNGSKVRCRALITAHLYNVKSIQRLRGAGFTSSCA